MCPFESSFVDELKAHLYEEHPDSRTTQALKKFLQTHPDGRGNELDILLLKTATSQDKSEYNLKRIQEKLDKIDEFLKNRKK